MAFSKIHHNIAKTTSDLIDWCINNLNYKL